MSCQAWHACLGVFGVTALIPAYVTERLLAPWLPWFRRYLATVILTVPVFFEMASRSCPWWINLTGIGLLYWNIWTGLHNQRRGKRGKPAPSLGAMLTALQTSAFQREAHDTR